MAMNQDVKQLGMLTFATLGAVALVAAMVWGGLQLFGNDEGDSKADEPETFAVRGTMSLTDYKGIFAVGDGEEGDGCTGEDGYDDIRAGVGVVIRDETGEKVALGRLGEGTLDASRESLRAKCVFPFTIEVPAGDSDLFSVEVGSRGEVTFNKADAQSVALSLG